MGKISKREARKAQIEQYKTLISQALLGGAVINAVSLVSSIMPPPSQARKILNDTLRICRRRGSDRSFRVFIVENLGNFKVMIQIPNGKKAYGLTRKELRELFGDNAINNKEEISCDFNVWILNSDGDLRLPTHDFMFNWYLDLKKKNGIDQIDLYKECVEALIRNRKPYQDILIDLKERLKDSTVRSLKEFLATLKWIVLQEDVNYKPPKYMGSMYTLAAYALLDRGFSPSEIRRLIQFRKCNYAGEAFNERHEESHV